MKQTTTSGQLNSFEYWVGDGQDILAIRRRSTGIHLQVMANTILLALFVYNFITSTIITCRYPRRLVSWCCLIPSTMGVIVFGIVVLPGCLPWGASCSSAVWSIVVGYSLSSMSVHASLLERAYYAHNRNFWLLAIGVLIIAAPSPVFIYLVWLLVKVENLPGSGCNATFPSFFPYFRLLLDAPPNIIFSVSFSIVFYQQYRRLGERCWKGLAQDGIITALLIITSNFICMLANVLHIFGPITDMVYILDW